MKIERNENKVVLTFENDYSADKIMTDIIYSLVSDEVITRKEDGSYDWVEPRKKSKVIGRSLGKALNYKFYLNSDPTIKFRNRREAYDYCRLVLGYDKAFRMFDKERMENII